MAQLDLAAHASGHGSLIRLGALAQRLGGMPQLHEASAPEARYGALMRLDQDDHPAAPALVAWAVAIADQDDWTPPAPRGPAVILARLWAGRSQWGKPTLGVFAALLIAALGVLGVDKIQASLAEREAARQALQVEAARQQLDSARSWLAERPELQPAVGRILQSTLGEAREELADAEAALSGTADPGAALGHLGRFDALRSDLQSWSQVSAAMEKAEQVQVPEAHASLRARFDGQLQQALRDRNADVAMDAANAILTLPQVLAQIEDRPRVDGADAEAQAALAAARARTDESLADGQLSLATSLLAAERDLARAINQAYTVRLVDRPGEKSGVWRYSEDSPNARDFYLVVEAVDASGAVLSLPIQNEETQRTASVRKFAVRVPEEIYNRYRDEKMAKGRIEQREIGAKARGALNMRFDLPSTGGFITEW